MSRVIVLADINERIRYPDGKVKTTKFHKLHFELPGMCGRDRQLLKRKSIAIIRQNVGDGHDFDGMLSWYDEEHAHDQEIKVVYTPPRIRYEVPNGYKKVEQKDGFVEGAKKAGKLLKKGSDWFFNEGEYAPKKKPATTKKKTTTKKTPAKTKSTTKKTNQKKRK